MSNPDETQTGPKLQQLIYNECITQEAANELTPAQRAAIENLSHAQIGNLIDAHKAVGAINTSRLI